MPKTTSELSQKERSAYQIKTILENRKRENQDLIEKRRKSAWIVARHAAEILIKDYGAKKVMVFGSLVNPFGFNAWSDIDLAAWGIADNKFYAAVAALIDLSSDLKIDLIDPESCKAEVKEIILAEGYEL